MLIIIVVSPKNYPHTKNGWVKLLDKPNTLKKVNNYLLASTYHIFKYKNHSTEILKIQSNGFVVVDHGLMAHLIRQGRIINTKCGPNLFRSPTKICHFLLSLQLLFSFKLFGLDIKIERSLPASLPPLSVHVHDNNGDTLLCPAVHYCASKTSGVVLYKP